MIVSRVDVEKIKRDSDQALIFWQEEIFFSILSSEKEVDYASVKTGHSTFVVDARAVDHLPQRAATHTERSDNVYISTVLTGAFSTHNR